jgi:hypothetical protein
LGSHKARHQYPADVLLVGSSDNVTLPHRLSGRWMSSRMPFSRRTALTNVSMTSNSFRVSGRVDQLPDSMYSNTLGHTDDVTVSLTVIDVVVTNIDCVVDVATVVTSSFVDINLVVDVATVVTLSFADTDFVVDVATVVASSVADTDTLVSKFVVLPPSIPDIYVNAIDK